MLYYRTSPGGQALPPELLGYSSTGPDAALHDQIIGGHRIVGITPILRFTPPDSGWVPLGDTGWQVVSCGEFEPGAHVRLSSSWKAAVVSVGRNKWGAPHVLTLDGRRSFKVAYGGPDFAPQLTAEQSKALDLATEIRTAIDGDALPDMAVQARWAASLLPLIYHLSPDSLALIGLPEELIEATLRVAAGRYEQG